MNECPQCETVWENGRFCPDCLYHLPGPSLREKLRVWLHRAALTAGENHGREKALRGRLVDAAPVASTLDRSPAVSVVVPSSGGES